MCRLMKSSPTWGSASKSGSCSGSVRPRSPDSRDATCANPSWTSHPGRSVASCHRCEIDGLGERADALQRVDVSRHGRVPVPLSHGCTVAPGTEMIGPCASRWSSSLRTTTSRWTYAASRPPGLFGRRPGRISSCCPSCGRRAAFCIHGGRTRRRASTGLRSVPISDAAKEIGAWVHAGSIIEDDEGSLHNTSVLLAPDGSVASTYRKVHLFGFSEGEPRLLTAGQDVVVAETDLGRIGLATCYDLRFPEQFRLLIDAGAELVLIPAAWPAPRVEHWSVLAQGPRDREPVRRRGSQYRRQPGRQGDGRPLGRGRCAWQRRRGSRRLTPRC